MPPWFFFLLSVLGLALAMVLIAFQGFADVGSTLLGIGWGLGLVVATRLVEMAGAGLAWRALLRPTPVPPKTFVFLRAIRESINALLPVAQVGGDLIGARLLTFYGPSGAAAGASVIVDLFLQTASQFLFTLVGFAILVSLGGNSPLVSWIAWGLLIAVPVLAAFYVVQRAGGLRLVEKLLLRFASQRQWFDLGKIGDLDAAIRRLYARPGALIAGFAIHLAAWLFGTVEVWVALTFMGHSVSVWEALCLEALGQAVKGAAFVVPGAYGIQEGGFVALCAVFGIPADAALALSLAKRVPDFAMGIPGLIAWQGLEGRRIWMPGARAARPTVPRSEQTH
jgi:putative membrane protein